MKFKFTFETTDDYTEATKASPEFAFDTVRFKVTRENGTIDYPVYSMEEYWMEMHRLSDNADKIIEYHVYPSMHFYDAYRYYESMM